MSEEREKIVGVNLGNWLVLEKWMQPFLFEENCAEDEVWLNRKVPAKKLRPLMKKHRDTYIEEADFAKIAAHGAPAGSIFRVRGQKTIFRLHRICRSGDGLCGKVWVKGADRSAYRAGRAEQL